MARASLATRHAALGFALMMSALPVPADQVQYFGSGGGSLGSSQVVRVGAVPLIHTAQLLPSGSPSTEPADSDASAQVSQVLESLGSALAETGSALEHVVRLNAVVTDTEAAAALASGVARLFPAHARPSLTLVQGALADLSARVAVDAVAISQGTDLIPALQPWHRSRSLPGAEGTTHAAVLPPGSRVYLSGRAADGNPSEATVDVLAQLTSTLDYLRLPRSAVTQLKCFVRPISAVPEVTRSVVEFFGGRAPPLVFVEWLNPRAIEIEAIVAGGPADAGAAGSIKYITPPGTTASPVFSRVTRVAGADTIYVSTLNGRTPNHGDRQIREMFADLSRLLSRAGSDLRHLAKATYFFSDDFTGRKLNEIRREFYDPGRPPAASKASVRGTAREGRTLAVDMIAVPAE